MTPTHEKKAALVMAATKGSSPLPHTVLATPRNENGGKTAMRWAPGTEVPSTNAGSGKTLASSPSRTTAIAKRTRTETRRTAAAGSTAIQKPAIAKTTKKLNALAESTAMACPAAKRKRSAKEPWLPTTATGTSTMEAALTTKVN